MDPLSPRQIRTPDVSAPVHATRPASPRDAEPGGPGVGQGARNPLLHPTHHERLGVPPDADEVTLSEAYQRAASEQGAEQAIGQDADATWPQPGVPETAAAKQRQLKLAYDVLQDPQRRAVYEQWLAREQQKLQAAAGGSARWRWALTLTVIAVLVLAVWALA